jgi:hypothetical protein
LHGNQNNLDTAIINSIIEDWLKYSDPAVIINALSQRISLRHTTIAAAILLRRGDEDAVRQNSKKCLKLLNHLAKNEKTNIASLMTLLMNINERKNYISLGAVTTSSSSHSNIARYLDIVDTLTARPDVSNEDISQLISHHYNSCKDQESSIGYNIALNLQHENLTRYLTLLVTLAKNNKIDAATIWQALRTPYGCRKSIGEFIIEKIHDGEDCMLLLTELLGYLQPLQFTTVLPESCRSFTNYQMKEKLHALISKLPAEQRTDACLQALNPDHPLGRLIYMQRGVATCDLESGMLAEFSETLITSLEEQQRNPAPAQRQNIVPSAPPASIAGANVWQQIVMQPTEQVIALVAASARGDAFQVQQLVDQLISQQAPLTLVNHLRQNNTFLICLQVAMNGASLLELIRLIEYLHTEKISDFTLKQLQPNHYFFNNQYLKEEVLNIIRSMPPHEQIAICDKARDHKQPLGHIMYLQQGIIPCSTLWGALGEISQLRRKALIINASSPQQQPQAFILQPHEAATQEISSASPPSYQDAMLAKEAAAPYLMQPHESFRQKMPPVQDGLYQQASAMLYMTPEAVQQLVTTSKQPPAIDDQVVANTDSAESIFTLSVAAPSSSKDLIDLSEQIPATQPASEVKTTTTPSQQGMFAAPATAARRLQQQSLLDLLDQLEVPTHLPQPIVPTSAQVQTTNTKGLTHA